ncbi:hypothetical protein PTI98_013407 [Pleurotus ostreatus]|nr:hypothetical protein PTI98_013407 [Pleurotus ostreatus]
MPCDPTHTLPILPIVPIVPQQKQVLLLHSALCTLRLARLTQQQHQQAASANAAIHSHSSQIIEIPKSVQMLSPSLLSVARVITTTATDGLTRTINVNAMSMYVVQGVGPGAGAGSRRRCWRCAHVSGGNVGGRKKIPTPTTTAILQLQSGTGRTPCQLPGVGLEAAA